MFKIRYNGIDEETITEEHDMLSFDYPYTNEFAEGCNNKIKNLKRNAYGYRNFERFHKRILHMFIYKNGSLLNVGVTLCE